MVIIITGTIGIGKTTVCQKFIEIARSHGYSCGGFITCKSADDDIVIKDVLTGITNEFASMRNIYTGPHTGRYFFNPEGIEFGIQALSKGRFANILVVDEIGQLELSGQGFAAIIHLITSDKIKNGLIVIRKNLLSDFLPLFGPKTMVFETTASNRDGLPAEIYRAISRTN